MTRRRAATAAPDSEEALLLSLGRLVSQAAEGVKLQQARAELAVELQRHMLPACVPDPPGMRIAARYMPAGEGLDIGGDWYDVFAMRDGSFAISIGDVEGHDMEAVAFMGQVRTGLRAVAFSTTDPGEVLGIANDLVLSMGRDLFATCSFFRFRPATLELDGARAGHLPLVWASLAGRVGITLDDGGLALGVLPEVRYPVTRRRLTEPGVLVLVTDGVVEGPAFSLEEGLGQVAQLVCAGCGAEPDDLADLVMKVADLTGHRDDAAVLVLQYDGAPAHG